MINFRYLTFLYIFKKIKILKIKKISYQIEVKKNIFEFKFFGKSKELINNIKYIDNNEK